LRLLASARQTGLVQRILVTASDDRAARIWDARTGQLLRLFEQAYSPQFSPDNSRMMLIHMDWTATIESAS
jgi:WD40 repeat protein